jgi:hypothetical protein
MFRHTAFTLAITVQRLLGRIGVDIAPGGAPLAMTLDAPPQKVETLVDMGDAGLFRRQA